MFDIIAKIYLDHQLILSPKLIAYPGQRASVDISTKENSEHLKVELIANDSPTEKMNDPIKIKFDVHYQKGVEDIKTKPTIIVLPNEVGIISFTTNSGHSYEMQVLVKRK